MTTSKKIILLISAQLILSASMHAMHNDDKTEADRMATLAAKTKTEKSAQAEDEGLLNVLGNPAKSQSLIALRDADNKANEIERAMRKTESLKLLIFNRLPVDLQIKIITEYWQGAVSRFVLRHQRELAPLVADYRYDANALLQQIDRLVKVNKLIINAIAPQEHVFGDLQKPLLKSVLTICPFGEPDFIVAPEQGSVVVDFSSNPTFKIFGYSDRTYMVKLDYKKLKKLMNTYSFEQISFFVSLAKIKMPDPGAIGRVYLTAKDCIIFKSLDYGMQGWLKKIYPCIDFYTPKDRSLSIDDKIENISHKIMAYVAHKKEELSYELKHLPNCRLHPASFALHIVTIISMGVFIDYLRDLYDSLSVIK